MNTILRASIVLGCMVSLLTLPYGVKADQQPASTDVKIWPFFYHAADPVSDTSRTELLWPLYVNERTSSYSAHQVLSFPQRYPSTYPHQFYLGWPLSGLRIGPGRYDAWLFPFLWSSEDHFTLFPVVWYGRRYFSLFPLCYYGRSGSNQHLRRTLNLCLLQHNSWSDRGRTHALWPLAWYKRYQYRSSRNRSLGVFPLFWNKQSAYTNKTTRSSSRSGTTLLLQGWRWNAHEYQSSNHTTISTNSAHWLFPLYYRSQQNRQRLTDDKTEYHAETTTQVALSWNQSKTTSAVNDEGEKTLISAMSRRSFFPVWWQWYRQFHNAHHGGHLLFPFWWHSQKFVGETLEESASFFIPIGAHLYKKGVYETRNILGPLFNRTRNAVEDYVRYDALFPFFSLTVGQNRTGGRVFPLMGFEREAGNYSNLWYLYPLGWNRESQERSAYRVPTPQFWALHESERRPFVASADCPQLGPRSLKAFYPFWWRRRSADVQSSALLPFWYQRTSRRGPTVSRDLALPLLLGVHGTRERNGEQVYSRHDYLLSLLAWGKGKNYRLNRLFPFWSYRRWSGHRRLTMLLPPFSRSSWRDSTQPEQKRSSSLSVPFSFLPWFGSRYHQRGTGTVNRSSWFFPLYKSTENRSPAKKVKKLSILWPLWNAEWERGETRVRGLGGLAHYYERDVNDFVEQRILHRLFTRRTRSWFSERELMPFYSSQNREDGNRYWKLLGGLLGSEIRDQRRYLRLLYIPIPMGKAARSSVTPEQQAVHADLALNYVRHARYDRAAIEFTLAGNARDQDLAFQQAAAEAYLDADPVAIGKELRSSVPSSLESLVGKGGYRNRHKLLVNLRQLAIARFEAAIALGGDEANLLQQMAIAHTDIGEFEKALECLNEAARIQPTFALVMGRLELLGMLGWDGSRAKPKPVDHKKWRREWFDFLENARRQYPDSPSLCRIEAEGPGSEKDDRYNIWGRYRYRYHRKNVFSDDTLRRLALFEQGASLGISDEEHAWLSGATGIFRRDQHAGMLFSWRYHWKARTQDDPVLPNRVCAQQAIFILNQQADKLISDKQYEKAEATFERILGLLPKACVQCDAEHPSAEPNASRYHPAVADAMRELYQYHVNTLKHPKGYLELAEKWSSRLCPHQQLAIEQALEPLRFELQYLKDWRITSVDKVQDYHGDFFARYVDLDRLLGKPDHCEATAECTLVVPTARDAVIRLGFDHRLTMELNGKEIVGGKACKIAVRDEFTVPVHLKAGENHLKLTLEDDTLAYGFFLRLSDTDGHTMKDLSIQ